MKKIIVATPYLSGKGGTETVINNLGEALKETNNNHYEWLLINFGGSRYSNWMDNWNKRVFKFSNIRLLQNLCYLFLMPFLIIEIFLKYKPDFFVSTNPIIWKMAQILKVFSSPKTKIIAWYHYSYKMKKVKLFFLKNIDSFWAISSGIKKELLSLGIPEERIHVIYNPIKFNSNTDIIPRSKNQNHFIYIGRIDYDGQKNVSELFKALSFIKKEWKCDLYGNTDEKTEKDLLNLLKNSRQKNQVEFNGFFKNVWNEIKEADALILTSKYEGFPMVLCEADSRGIPLIAANCPTGVKDIVNTKNGFLYEPGDFKRLSIILASIIDNKQKLPDPDEIQKTMESFKYNNYLKRVFESLEVM